MHLGPFLPKEQELGCLYTNSICHWLKAAGLCWVGSEHNSPAFRPTPVAKEKPWDKQRQTLAVGSDPVSTKTMRTWGTWEGYWQYPLHYSPISISFPRYKKGLITAPHRAAMKIKPGDVCEVDGSRSSQRVQSMWASEGDGEGSTG